LARGYGEYGELAGDDAAGLDDLLTRAEAAELAHYHVSTIDRAIGRGVLPATYPNGRGGSVRIVRRDLLRWLGLLVLALALVLAGVRGCSRHRHGAPAAKVRHGQTGPRAAMRVELRVVALLG